MQVIWKWCLAALVMVAAVAVSVNLMNSPAKPAHHSLPSLPPVSTPKQFPATTFQYVTTGHALFRTVDNTIHCDMRRDHTRCDITQRRWKAPAISHCDMPWVWGSSVVVDAKTAGLGCYNDSIADDRAPILANQSFKVADYVCSRWEGGMGYGVECKNTQTTHGFRVSQSDYQPF